MIKESLARLAEAQRLSDFATETKLNRRTLQRIIKGISVNDSTLELVTIHLRKPKWAGKKETT